VEERFVDRYPQVLSLVFAALMICTIGLAKETSLDWLTALFALGSLLALVWRVRLGVRSGRKKRSQASE
jgi:hypothetical protein